MTGFRALVLGTPIAERVVQSGLSAADADKRHIEAQPGWAPITVEQHTDHDRDPGGLAPNRVRTCASNTSQGAVRAYTGSGPEPPARPASGSAIAGPGE
jgi:hypothetical protein